MTVPDPTATRPVASDGDPGAYNRGVWARGGFVGDYASRQLRPVEVLLMVRYRESLAGSVLELGSGAGRIAGYLCELAADCHGIDVSPQMVQESRRRYPSGHFELGDFRDLSRFADGSLDAVWAGCNILDILGDSDRRAALREIRRVLADDGLLIMSSHNRAYLPRVTGPLHIRTVDPLRFGFDLLRAPGRFRRHRRLRRLEVRHPDYALVSDGAHNFTLVHYFTTPEAQFRQLEQEGFSPSECLDLDGRVLGPGDTAPSASELHYVARRR